MTRRLVALSAAAVLLLAVAVGRRDRSVEAYRRGLDSLAVGRLDDAAREFHAAAVDAPTRRAGWAAIGYVRARQAEAAVESATSEALLHDAEAALVAARDSARSSSDEVGWNLAVVRLRLHRPGDESGGDRSKTGDARKADDGQPTNDGASTAASRAAPTDDRPPPGAAVSPMESEARSTGPIERPNPGTAWRDPGPLDPTAAAEQLDETLARLAADRRARRAAAPLRSTRPGDY
ncbi:MAG: hypothetical protein ACRC1K_08070 [Planctomycetia bacterium]